MCGDAQRSIIYSIQSISCVAPGVRLIDDAETSMDLDEAGALSHRDQLVTVSCNSWGPYDDGTTVDGPDMVTRMAFEKSAELVRGGTLGEGWRLI